MGSLVAGTTAGEVLTHFLVSQAAQSAYESWREDERYKSDVVPCVLAHKTRVAYRLIPDDVERACQATKKPGGHALGWVKKADADRVPAIADWNPPFAFGYLFHRMLETGGRIPEWRDVSRYISNHPDGVHVLGSAIRRAHADHDATYGRQLVEDAIQWRLGNAYYSFLRELHVLSHLRARGLDAQVHPLADALFRVDAWCGNRVLCLYIGNKAYRNEHEGRKKEAVAILGAQNFEFDVINLPPATTYGEVHLPTTSDIEEHLRRLLASG
ncbi:hypothetical protein [Streptomyces iconiensis]|uniref:Uncharacterized protein n=1 Tax=Streptomyces iconiensis TaxID=1384038 RepID=A0ABT6ZZL1_9ACTN|nr:hypothetical protein [Streptomyces iconiensis]MDJ1134511.1 hypothetical protein [Streptomyces iconiensis]